MEKSTSTTSAVRLQRQNCRTKTAIQRLCCLDIDSQASTVNNTAIMCTIGPACSDPAILADMMEAGMAIARLNLSYGTRDEHRRALKLLTEAEALRSQRLNGAVRAPLAIALETRGRRIRTGPVTAAKAGGKRGVVAMEIGSEVTISCAANPSEADAESTPEKLWLSWPEFARLVRPGQAVVIDDGAIQLRVTELQPDAASVKCTVEVGGQLESHRSVCLPGLDTGLPDLSQEDLEDLAWLAPDGACCIVLASFVSSGETVKKIRTVMATIADARRKHAPQATQPLVVAEICDVKGLNALDEILTEADAVLVARGDLGAELPQQKIFAAQKRILARCGVAGKASICSTHLLESMLVNPRPTRAEASDVANAVMDGVDCLMLSAETAVGRHPVKAVQILAKICREAESAMLVVNQRCAGLRHLQLHQPVYPQTGSALAACEAAYRCQAAVILVFAKDARLLRLVGMHRPHCPVVTACRDAGVCKGLSLWYGLHALHYEGKLSDQQNPKDKAQDSISPRIRFSAKYAQARGLLRPTDLVVLLVEKSTWSSSDLMAVMSATRLLPVGAEAESDISSDDECEWEERASIVMEAGADFA